MYAALHSDEIKTVEVSYCKVDGQEAIVALGDIASGVRVWLTPEQANDLYAKLGAWLQDQKMRAHPETMEPLAVDQPGVEVSPVTLHELVQRGLRGDTPSNEEIIRRAGF